MSNNNKRSLKDIQTTCMQMNNKKKNESSLPSSQLWSLLPEEIIIYNILLNLPVDTLLRLRCVCRYFHTLITNPSFIQNHLYQYSNAQPNLSLLRLSTSKVYRLYNEIEFRNFINSTVGGNDIHPNIVMMRSPFESAIRASCNGLLFLGGENNKDPVFIWNPCTKEYKELPLPSTTKKELILKQLYGTVETSGDNYELSPFMFFSGFCGFGYDRTNDEYKILYHEIWIGSRGRQVTKFKLYRLRTDTWTSFSNKQYRSFFWGDSSERNERKQTGLYVNGALYWIMLSKPYNVWGNVIVSFDMEKEEFQEIQLPPLMEKDPHYDFDFQLQVLEGYLCLSYLPRTNIIKRVDIWMLKDYAVKDSWTKLFTIMLPDSLSVWEFRLLRFCENGEIIMRSNVHNLTVYDPANQKTEHVEDLDAGILWAWEDEVIYKESLVSLNSGTYSSI